MGLQDDIKLTSSSSGMCLGVNSGATSSNYSVGSVPSVTWTTSALNTSSNLSGYNYSDCFIDPFVTSYVGRATDFLTLFVLSHNEDEILASLKKIKELSVYYKDHLSIIENIDLTILRVKHFSEEFILALLDDIKDNEKFKNSVLVHHAGDIYSKQYSTLALKLISENNV